MSRDHVGHATGPLAPGSPPLASASDTETFVYDNAGRKASESSTTAATIDTRTDDDGGRML